MQPPRKSRTDRNPKRRARVVLDRWPPLVELFRVPEGVPGAGKETSTEDAASHSKSETESEPDVVLVAGSGFGSGISRRIQHRQRRKMRLAQGRGNRSLPGSFLDPLQMDFRLDHTRTKSSIQVQVLIPSEETPSALSTLLETRKQKSLKFHFCLLKASALEFSRSLSQHLRRATYIARHVSIGRLWCLRLRVTIFATLLEWARRMSESHWNVVPFAFGASWPPVHAVSPRPKASRERTEGNQ